MRLNLTVSHNVCAQQGPYAHSPKSTTADTEVCLHCVCCCGQLQAHHYVLCGCISGTPEHKEVLRCSSFLEQLSSVTHSKGHHLVIRTG